MEVVKYMQPRGVGNIKTVAPCWLYFVFQKQNCVHEDFDHIVLLVELDITRYPCHLGHLSLSAVPLTLHRKPTLLKSAQNVNLQVLAFPSNFKE